MIHLDFSNIDESDISTVSKALKTGYVSTHGPQVPEFEQAMARYLGVPDALATNSGTAALHLALMEAGVGPGDEVILPVLTFVATANVVRYVGAKPVFVDVDRDAWCIDIDCVRCLASEDVVIDNPETIIAVHLYGHPCDMDAVWLLAETWELCVIEDAAESLGTTYNDRLTGTFGDYGCFSFNGNKTMTTGGGGLVITRDRVRVQSMREQAMQARNEAGEHDGVGYNYRMTNLAAALGLAQLARLDEFLAKKRRFAEIYAAELGHLVEFQKVPPGGKSSYWLTAVLLPEGMDVEKVQERLNRKGVPTRRVFRPLNHYEPYKDGRVYENAEYIWKHGLCLPSSTLNSEGDILTACEGLRGVL